ncbi:putative P450 monooxygenase [Piedraia hortae CBS 480.64]|uniref:Putative P450 monooxygenase n=1 Tax=Piedraia hortae CBS 480.64 TaxID=1314780 RepID=A0A6A7BU81_9PEZI|nr:putative P450 monooxygenase [Piedraia hortae CBS 480.64]
MATLILLSAAESLLITKLASEHVPILPLFIGLFIVQAAVVSFYNVHIYPSYLTPLKNLPIPDGAWPIIGHTLTVFERPPSTSFQRWMHEVPNDGLIRFRGLFNADRLLVTSPKVVGEMLVTKPYEFEKPEPTRNFLRYILGNGLIVVEGEEHRFQRKNLSPMFGFRPIKNLYPVFWEKAIQMTDGIARELPEIVEITHWANRVTMDVIGLAAMGRDLHVLQKGDDELVRTYEEITEPTREKLLYFAARVLGPAALVKRLPLHINRRLSIIIPRLRTICLSMVQGKKSYPGKSDILTLLLQSGNFSDNQLVDQLLTFLAAGAETTSSAFTWSTYLLSNHPTTQTFLRNELRTHLPEIQTDPSVLETLPLLNGICNETLRLYPTVPATVRKARETTTLVGHIIPAGCELTISPWAINRSPDLWGPNAEDFIPERWIDKETGKLRGSGGAESNYAFVTFLHGPRSCLGKGFALAELRALLAAMVLRFEFEGVRDGEVVPHGVITLKPRDGLKLRVWEVE